MESSPFPKRLADFPILRELGRGGMGIVYEARQISLNRKVALKVLSSSLGLTARSVLRFRREAEAAAKLHHTNIVPIHATGVVDWILGHALGGITYRHYAHRAPWAFKAITTLPQPTAFSALAKGLDGQCPCCRRPFVDAT
jgi:serine/threonine protein kinase